jgi:hemerythrin
MTSTLPLGDAALDEDHARLQDLIQMLVDAPVDGAVQALDLLREHAAQHFAVEDLDLRAPAAAAPPPDVAEPHVNP